MQSINPKTNTANGIEQRIARWRGYIAERLATINNLPRGVRAEYLAPSALAEVERKEDKPLVDILAGHLATVRGFGYALAEDIRQDGNEGHERQVCTIAVETFTRLPVEIAEDIQPRLVRRFYEVGDTSLVPTLARAASYAALA